MMLVRLDEQIGRRSSLRDRLDGCTRKSSCPSTPPLNNARAEQLAPHRTDATAVQSICHLTEVALVVVVFTHTK